MIVLVVDDSNFNLVVAEKHLKEIEEVSQVILCDNPAEVKNIIDDKNIDILVLDLVMPKITGFDILGILRSQTKYNDIPIIVFTSLDDVDSFKKCFEMGASDYINKPIREYEFRARLSAAIRLRANTKRIQNLLEFATSQNEELKEMNQKLSDAKLHLIHAEKMAAIGQLAAGVAHEINNPMGFISSNFEVINKYLTRISEYIIFVNEEISDKNIPQEIKKQLQENYKKLKIDIILEELNGILTDSKMGICRVNDIVHSLTAFSRSSSGAEKDSYNLIEILNQVILLSKNEVKYVAEIEIDVPDDMNIFCNKIQIGQVLLNIIVNAAQAIKSQNHNNKGKIKISAASADEYVVIKIADDGPGIPKEIISKIFEPFFTTKDVGQGTGLGLSISYDIIVNKHQGKIDIDTSLGIGTVFIISIPIK